MTTENRITDTRVPERRFTVRTEPRNEADHGWSGTLVTVLDRGTPCGSYRRNYHCFGAATFEPFSVGGEWFALYSPDYTATRIMRLPSCEDIGGEEPDDCGFCPVELFVPAFRLHSWDATRCWRGGERVERHVERDSAPVWEGDRRLAAPAPGPEGGGAWEFGWSIRGSHRLDPWEWCPFGFVAGCVWGDDATNKLEFLDLSRASEGILRREDRFGYLELPPSMRMRDAIDLSGWHPDGSRSRIRITRTDDHDLSRSGR